jgi:hypothetical protein
MKGGENMLKSTFYYHAKEQNVRRESEVKSSVIRKVSQALVTLMVISILMPVLAFAATGFKDVSYDGSTIRGTVYSDVYSQTGIDVAVYGNGTQLSLPVSTATYSVYTDVYNYTFSFNVGAYRYIDLKVGDAVYTAVYDVTPPAWSSSKTLYASGRTKTSINLAWSGVNEAGVTYHVYKNGSLVATVTEATYNVTGLSADTAYDFTVQAADVLGNISTDGPTARLKTDSDSSSSSSGGGGGGGGGSNGQVTAGSDGKVDAYALKNALSSSDNVTVKISGEHAILPASALVDAVKKGAAVTVVSDNGSYVLPLSILNLDALAKALGVTVDDLNIKVTIAKVTGDLAQAVKDAAAALGATPLADAVDFNVVAESKDGKTTSIDFGKTYVSRSINVSKAVDTKKTTGVLYNEVTKKLSFVPATFETNDGKTVATLKRNGNSIYTVVENNKSFDDIASHWAKADIELLANKLVVDGVTDTKFEADRNITRAEFAALVVRSLGLSSASSAVTFKDVKSDAWYADVVATAANAGIINGYEDNTFRPDAQITREELAAMVIRAMNFADIATSVSEEAQAAALGKFKDADKIVWAKAEIAAAINAGLINGMTDDTIGPDGKATRAQSATMLKRFLSTAHFIN